jgi:hypothetical protein
VRTGKPRIIGGAIGEQIPVVRSVKVHGITDLAHVVQALDTAGAFLGAAQRRQQHRRQNGDDGDDHQQFNQGEAPPQTCDHTNRRHRKTGFVSNYFGPVSNHICPPEGKTGQLFSAAHAADDARTLWRIHSGTLHNARRRVKCVCEAGQRKLLFTFSTTSISRTYLFRRINHFITSDGIYWNSFQIIWH